MWKASRIYRILLGLAAILIKIYLDKGITFKFNRIDDLLWIFPVGVALLEILEALKKDKPVEVDNTSQDAIAEKVANLLRKDIQKAFPDNLYLDGLPETQDPLLQEKLRLGTEEMLRASKYDEAVANGNSLAARQFHEATLKAVEYYKQGLTLDLKTSERCALLNLTALAYKNISELDQAFVLWTELRKTAETMILSAEVKTARDGQKFMAIVLGNMGLVYDTKGDLDKALEMYEKALALNLELGSKVGIANQYGNKGNVYFTKGDLDKALEMHQKALDIDIEMGNKQGMAQDYGNMGLVYYTKGDLDKALEMHRKALDIDIEMGNKEGIAHDYGNMGVVYKTKGDLDKALEMYDKALKISLELGSKEGVAIQYGNMGNVYLTKGDLDKALEMYDKGLKIDIELGRKEGIAANYGNMGIVYETKGDLLKAKKYYTKALKLFEEIGAKIEIETVKRNLAKLEAKRKL
jgi:tetratricopeptide (TPR) repeat protein